MKTKNWKRYLATLILAAVGLTVYAFVIGCPMRRLFGIRCPLCGMTRAWVCAFRFQFRRAFVYHPLWPAAAVVLPLYLILEMRKRSSGRVLGLIAIGVCIVVFAIRLCFKDPVVMPKPSEGLITGLIIKLFR